MTTHYNYRFYDTDYKVKVTYSKYENGQNAVLLESLEEDLGYYEHFMVASVALDKPLAEDLVYIKNYGENEGILDFLIENGFVGKPLYYVRSGYVEIPVCKLLKNN